MPRGSGRRPLPTKIKKLRGNPGQRKLNDAEPNPASGDPAMPIDLSPDAIKEWKAILPELRATGMLSKLDGKALAAYCHQYARWMEAERTVLEYGIVIKEGIFSKDGDELGYRLKKNPAVTISEKSVALMKSFLVEFGMTPSSRTRIRIEKPTDEDPIDAFLRGAPAQPAKNVN